MAQSIPGCVFSWGMTGGGGLRQRDNYAIVCLLKESRGSWESSSWRLANVTRGKRWCRSCQEEKWVKVAPTCLSWMCFVKLHLESKPDIRCVQMFFLNWKNLVLFLFCFSNLVLFFPTKEIGFFKVVFLVWICDLIYYKACLHRRMQCVRWSLQYYTVWYWDGEK